MAQTITRNINTSLPPGRIPGAPAVGGSQLPTTPHDNLPMPDGRKLGQVDELARVLVDLQIPGASHSKGRATNAAAYALHLQNMREEAGAAAINSWLLNQKA